MSIGNDDNVDYDTIVDGERVLLYLDERRTWLVRAKSDSDEKFHTHAGIVDLSKIVGMRYGDILTTTLGETIVILRPVAIDYIMKSERRTQIVYPKDMGYIGTRSGLRSGSRVLECGTGSGGLTTYFASIVAPNGLIHTFEAREDFFRIAQHNVEKAGLSKFVKFENVDLVAASSRMDTNGLVKPSSYDLAMIDIGDPWTLLDASHKALKGSAFAFCICPTMNQLELVAEGMKGKFVDVEAEEILFRRIEARSGKTRPSMRMIGHTCYLISGRKINSRDPGAE